MATKKLVAPNSMKKWQVLRLDSLKRYVLNHNKKSQMIFPSDADFSLSNQFVKIAAEFDALNLDRIRFTSYLYNRENAAIDSGSSCEFKISSVSQPGWIENVVATFNGAVQLNSQFFAELLLNTVPSVNFFGDSTMAIECSIVRNSITYRDKVYVNHLGIYDNILRLRNEVEFINITKLDE